MIIKEEQFIRWCTSQIECMLICSNVGHFKEAGEIQTHLMFVDEMFTTFLGSSEAQKLFKRRDKAVKKHIKKKLGIKT